MRTLALLLFGMTCIGCGPSSHTPRADDARIASGRASISESPEVYEANSFSRSVGIDESRADMAVRRVVSVEDLPRWADVVHAVRLRNTTEGRALSKSSELLLSFLLDSKRAESRFGETIHVVSRNGVFLMAWDPTIRNQGEPHTDKTVCVLAQLGIEASRPLAIQEQQFQVADLVVGAMNNFSWVQENAFTTVALLHYLPGMDGWQNKHGEIITFDANCTKLCDEVHSSKGSCFGTHNLFALAMLLRADARYPILAASTRSQAEDTLRFSLNKFLDCFRTANPHEPSFDTLTANRAADPRNGDNYLQVTSVVISSHYLEVLAFAPDNITQSLRAEEATRYALEFVIRRIELAPADNLVTFFGPYSHAANAVALFHSKNTTVPANTGAKLSQNLSDLSL